MITPCTRVRFQYSRHQGMSYRVTSCSVIFVCPQRKARRNQGMFAASAFADLDFSADLARRVPPDMARDATAARPRKDLRETVAAPRKSAADSSATNASLL